MEILVLVYSLLKALAPELCQGAPGDLSKLRDATGALSCHGASSCDIFPKPHKLLA